MGPTNMNLSLGPRPSQSDSNEPSSFSAMSTTQKADIRKPILEKRSGTQTSRTPTVANLLPSSSTLKRLASDTEDLSYPIFYSLHNK